MTLDAYPDDAEIVATNFKTDQQADAAETIAEEWPVDLDRLAEEGQHVKMFYKQVLDQFLGPADGDATFADLKDEYGSLEQWAEDGGDDEADSADDEEDEDAEVEVPDVEDIEPGAGVETAPDSSSDAQSAAKQAVEETMSVDVDASEDVDDRRRAWFRAGFREGVEFALENPELFERD
ncbi:hypothetical protein [Halapricum salinum]|uniref:Uncharacterized protein n=1 Tax=Halapricum salinum TaxID=1457250 RepID=A0A4D6HD43_9EURY|nr:hypothetical protein [Halapricum salinum]QCC50982.1 hypothetical protein DV733_06865 [Halapricum salinum]